MSTQEIIKKVNEIVKENFTKIAKARKNAGACFLILAYGTGDAIYGSYKSEAIYYINKQGECFTFRK